ncbi:MAG: PQQ-like beta-propeller repeat protein [Armatimonadetes bacterium]|nr:PQQ-like beta-propeller repeat protein [Armatimonadota bacterium]
MSRWRRLAAAGLALALGGCGPRLPERVVWRLKFNDVVAAPPALGPDGTIYVGSHDRTFSAISPTGERRWTQTAGDYFHAPAAVDTQRVIVGSFDHNLYAYDLAGRLLWQFRTNASIEAGAALAADGSVYLPGLDDHLYALDPAGRLRWRFTAADDIGGSPALTPEGDIVFADKSLAGYLYRLSPAGELRWRVPVGSPVLSSPAIGRDGTIYVAPKDKALVALSPDGRERWRFATEGSLIASPTVDAQGNVYFNSYDGGLYSVDPSGRQRWVFRTFTPSSSSPTLGAGDRVYFGADSHAVYSIDATNGKLLWKVPTAAYVTSSAVIAPDGTLYIGSNDGYLYAIRSDSHGLAPGAPWPHLRGGPLCLGRQNLD